MIKIEEEKVNKSQNAGCCSEDRLELAINGGAPVRKTLLPYGRQHITEDDIQSVNNVLRSDWLTTGPEIERFEKSLAKVCRAKHAVVYANGTAALHGAYFAAGISTGDEIITSAMTFAATGNAALYLGAKPVFADIEPDTGNIDVDTVEAKITGRTHAIVGVDFGGHPCEADRLQELAQTHELKLIIDGAHSLGASYNGRPVGSLADMTTFSFHPVKAITCGEGGAVVTDSDELYERLRAFRTHGIEKDRDKLGSFDGPWYHEMQQLGFNYRITDFQAALGTSQLARLESFIERRREIAAEYRKAFESISGIKALAVRENVESAQHLFQIRVTREPVSANRRKLFDALRAENIGVQVHYIPVYNHPYYKANVSCESACPETDAFYDAVISLPIFPKMSQSDVDDVILAVNKVSGLLL